MSERERGKPFVAYMPAGVAERGLQGNCAIYASPGSSYNYVPCVVTPLLPDDPRVGETWWWDGDEAIIIGTPFDYKGERYVPAICVNDKWMAPIRDMTRAPTRKAFRVTSPDVWLARDYSAIVIHATSREEAVRKLADALEEI